MARKTCDFEVAVKQPASRMWKALVEDAHIAAAAIMPERYERIEIVEGAHIATGSVRLVKFGKKGHHGCGNSVKEKFEEVDHNSFFARLRLTEGEALAKHWRTFSYTIKITSCEAGGESSSVVHYSLEYESIGENKYHEKFKEEIIQTIRSVEAYLNANPSFGCVCN